MVKVAVCLSGCGFLDGAEIHEAVCTLLALDQAGAGEREIEEEKIETALV